MKKQTLNHQMITSQLSEFSSKEFLSLWFAVRGKNRDVYDFMLLLAKV
jgi:hypothetical protein